MYKVLHYFTDLQDHNYPYNEGDIFPRSGLRVSDTRLNELASGDNRQGKPLICFVEDEPQKAETEVNPVLTEKKPKKAATGKRKAAEK